MSKIEKIHAREILDSRGNPTIECEITLEDGSYGRAAVPSGSSTGSHEALELRDKDPKRYLGTGTLTAVKNVNTTIDAALCGFESSLQADFDQKLIDLDGTEYKSNLGANAILSVSLAYAWASAMSQNKKLYEYIGELFGNTNFILPRPMMNIMNGGKHADWATDIQEYMVIPMKPNTWAENLRICTEIYLNLGKLIKSKGLSTNVGNEGGYAPSLTSNQEAIDLIVAAIEKAGYKLGEDVKLGFDAAASEFYNEETKQYDLKRDKKTLSNIQMVDWAEELCKKYPFESIEDWAFEDDLEGWGALTARIGENVQIVGDDLLVTNVKRIEMAIEKKLCNALLVKMNQIGTLTETLHAMKMAKDAGWNNVVSHRSGETEDVTLAHLVVGTGAGQIKCGAPARSERNAKYNELLRIEEHLQGIA
jgi:enolase